MSDVQLGYRITSANGTGTLTVGLPFGGEATVVESGRRLKLPGKIDRLAARMRTFMPAALVVELQARLVTIEADLVGADADLRREQKSLDGAEDALAAARAKRGDSERRERAADAVAQIVREAGQAVEHARVHLQKARAYQHGIAERRDDLQARLADIAAAAVYQRLRPRLDVARDDLAAREATLTKARAAWLAEVRAGDGTTGSDALIGRLTVEASEASGRVALLTTECAGGRCAMRRAAEAYAQHVAAEAAGDLGGLIEDRKADLVKLALPLALEVIALEQSKAALHEQATRLRYNDE